MTRDLRQSNRQTSHVNNQNASFANRGAVYNAPVTHNTIINDDSVNYEVNHEDVEGLEKFSLWVMKTVGEKRAKLIAMITVVLGGGELSLAFYPNSPAPPSILTPLALSSLVFLVVGAAMIAALQYKANSRCVKCNRFYAMQETGQPQVREVERRGGIQVTTTRHYACRHCGNAVTKKQSQFVEDPPVDDDD